MKTLLSFCLYLALLNSVASLTCYSCMILGKECKHPVTMECDSSEQSCVSAVAQGSIGALKMSMSFMSCIESQYCSSGYYSTSITKSLRSHIKVSCCQTDKCNNMSVKVPQDEVRTPNGLKCPSCYALHSDHCKAQDTVECIHKEDHCFNFGIKLHNGTRTQNFAAQGCGTKDVCVVKKGVVDAANHSLKGNITHAECYLAKSHLSHDL